MTQAETTTELPGRTPGRAARIAAIHMLADWLTEHDEIPIPDVLATYHPSEGDQAARYQEIELLAERLGAREYGHKYGDHSPQFDYTVCASDVHGIEITYRGSTHSDARYSEPL